MAKRRNNKKVKVLMASAEASPLAKVGGLSDVVGSLPKALNELECDARVIMPKYGSIDQKKYDLKKIKASISIEVDGKKEKVSIWQTKKAISGTTVYLIGNKRFDKPEVYHGDNSERFLFFSAACLEVLPLIGFKPNVIHCHDFHSAFILPLLKSGNYPQLSEIKTVYTIHNLKYQGKTTPKKLKMVDMHENSLASIATDAADGDINFMVQGIINSDIFNTVSPTYAKEITQKEQGAGLDRVIRTNKDKLYGIINGLDTDSFDPAKDNNIAFNYSVKDLSKKNKNKLHLQKLLGLPEDGNKALVGFISRLAWQKGLELITEKMIKECDCQFVFLGTGEKKYEDKLKRLGEKYPNKVSANIMFDISLAQKIYAGSDIFLMPSRFEPCGLGQMIAMRYGTVVVARATGGLKDTVDGDVGFKFTEFKSEKLQKTLQKCLRTYYNNSEKWLKLQKNCLKKDFSWKNSAKQYQDLYKQLLAKKA